MGPTQLTLPPEPEPQPLGHPGTIVWCLSTCLLDSPTCPSSHTGVCPLGATHCHRGVRGQVSLSPLWQGRWVFHVEVV